MRTCLPVLALLFMACDHQPDHQTSLAGRVPDGEAVSHDGPAPADPAKPGDYVRLHVVRIMDHSGFGQPVEAARFLVPVDWRTEGGVAWSQSFGCLYLIVNAHIRFTAPDGLTALEIFPVSVWNWYDDPYQLQLVQQQLAQGGPARPCDLARPTDAASYLRGRLVPAARGGAQITTVERQPDVAAASRRSLQAYSRQAAAYGLQMQLDADAARVRLRYQVQGRPVEEWITATVQSNRTMAPSAAAAMQGGAGYAAVYTQVATAQIGTRAPAGRLDELGPLFSTMIASYRPNLAWTNAVQQVMTNMGNTAIQGAADRSRIWSQANREISDIIRQGYDYQQQSQNRIAESWSQTTRGVETYVDPGTNERVELSSGYTQAWSNGQGEYILSDSPNFNPNHELRGNWRELRKGP